MHSNLLQRLSQLMILKAGPQDLPSSFGLLRLSGALFVGVALLRMIPVTGLTEGLAQALLSLFVLFAFVRSLLNWRKVPERLTQSLTALLLANAIIVLLQLFPLRALTPALIAISENPNLDPTTIELPTLAVYSWLLVSIWGLIVNGHIYRHTLNVTLGMGVAIHMIYEFLLIGVVAMLSRLF